MSQHQLTPAAERALDFARAWKIDPQSREIQPVELLCGLLAEPECQAAIMLAAEGIDTAAVQARWPTLRWAGHEPGEQFSVGGGGSLSAAVREALDAAENLLFEYPQPVTLATEHLLLGLAAAGGELATWLADRGWPAAELEAQVHRLAGHESGPVDVELDEEVATRGRPATFDNAECGMRNAALGEAAAPVTLPSLQNDDATGLWRALDAAANRAGEGLRVVEDYVRFVLNDAHLTATCKQLRHDFAAVLAGLPASSRRAARDVPGDVGTEITTAAEQRRLDARAVAEASCQRVQQALRSLEEFSKPLDSGVARRFEQLRYRSYTLERAIDKLASSSLRLADARLYILVGSLDSTAAFERLVKMLVAGEADVIQLRDKGLPDRTLLERAKVLAAAVAGSRTLFIMNDRPDLAALAGAAGVHVGQDELSVSEARAIVGPRALVGVSTHTIEQARAAVLDGADYIGVGPTFPSQTKAFAAFAGLDFVAAVAREIRLPAFAIGGIDEENLPQVIRAGLRRVAVSGAVTRAADPLAAVRRLKEMLHEE